MIYIVRHGQTDWNLLGKNQGQQDTELNDAGINQAKILAEKLKDIEFDFIVSSPLKRALKTAEIICGGKVIVDERLKERFNGELEGKTNSNDLIDFSDPNDNRYGVEPLVEFKKRIYNFWNEITSKYQNKNILVVTHAGVILYTQEYFKGIPKDNNYTQYKIKNCDILQFDNTKTPV